MDGAAQECRGAAVLQRATIYLLKLLYLHIHNCFSTAFLCTSVIGPSGVAVGELRGEPPDRIDVCDWSRPARRLYSVFSEQTETFNNHLSPPLKTFPHAAGQLRSIDCFSFCFCLFSVLFILCLSGFFFLVWGVD